MEFQRLLLTAVIFLLAVEYSNAKCYQGHIGGDRKDLNDFKFLCGRKLLQGLKVKSVGIQGETKPTDLDNSFQVPEKESDPIQKHSQKPVAKGTRRSSGNKKAVHKDDDYMTEKNERSTEAADEVVNLMRKDYKGADRPRRKPPINNNDPKN